jgi:fumarate hydratase subunit beta
MKEIKVQTPINIEQSQKLKCGDRVLITGTIYSARDAAHMRLLKEISCGKELPFDLEGSIIYYAGPSPVRPGNISGSFGPTTSGRMDSMTIPLLDLGLMGMIGKGNRSKAVIDSIVKHNAIYFAAIGGAGALIASTIKKIEVIAYEELGPEAIMKLDVENFPAFVAIDSRGNNIYERKK